MNTYKVLLPILFHGEHKQGDEFEYEFATADEEQAQIDSGILEIVPRTYKVIGTSVVYDAQPGNVFDKALTIGQEAHLVAAGHIERVETKKASKKDAKADE